MSDIINDGEPVTLGDLVRDYPQADELRITVDVDSAFWGRAAYRLVVEKTKLKEQARIRDLLHKGEVEKLTRERVAAERDRDIFGAKWKLSRDANVDVQGRLDRLEQEVEKLKVAKNSLDQSYKGANEQINDMHASHKDEIEKLKAKLVRHRDSLPDVEYLRDQIKEVDEILDWFGTGRVRLDALRDLKDLVKIQGAAIHEAQVSSGRMIDRDAKDQSHENMVKQLCHMRDAAVNELTSERAAIRGALGGDDTRPFNTRIREMKMKLVDIQYETITSHVSYVKVQHIKEILDR